MSVYPTPKFFEYTNGQFQFEKKIICIVPKAFQSDEIFMELWNNYTFGSCAIELKKQGEEQQIMFGTFSDSFDIDGNEYGISAKESGVLLKANSAQGLLHALFTFLQLIKPLCLEEGNEAFCIPCVKLFDTPAVNFRGTHLCIFPETKLSFLKKTVRLCCFLKYTHIVLEFWGMLQYDCMKELAWENAYTKDEIKPILKEATDMGVEIIPMFNHLGHATASRSCYGKHVVLDQNPKKSLLFEPDGWTWCISNPETRVLLKSVRDELIALCGNATYFHIGCDEAYSFATCDVCTSTDKIKLLADYINEVADDLKLKGIRTIMWGDALLEHEQWKSPYEATSRADQGTHQILPALRKDIIIDDWQYNIKSNDVQTIKHFKENGFDVLVSPFDDSANIKALAEATIHFGAYGFLGTTWHTLHQHFGMLLFAAQNVWSGKPGVSNFYDTESAQLQRKICPVNGAYDEAGWNEKQV
jgi:N-acetyl-beta-hexosaminidase